MAEINNRFWSASLEEIKQGYAFDPSTDGYNCLVCGASFTRGYIYVMGDRLLEAQKAAQTHISQEHSSVFEYLLTMDKKYTGLTEHQKSLLSLFYQGYSDREVAEMLNSGSTSTIRNHRFMLREKEKQARIFLAIMELLENRGSRPRPEQSSRPKAGEPSYRVETRVLKNYFKEGMDGPLSRLPKKEQQRLIVLRHLAGRFDQDRRYTEKEVNEILKSAYHDYVTLRRYLVDYGLLQRHADGSLYWVSAGRAAGETEKGSSINMDERKKMILDYKQNPPPSGVYQIKNLVNGKILVGKSSNVNGALNRDRFSLNLGSHRSRELQREWNQFGEENFAFSVLEMLERDDDPRRSYAEELKEMEDRWLEKLQPYGDKGYNRPPRK